jgi:hypothetical protein
MAAHSTATTMPAPGANVAPGVGQPIIVDDRVAVTPTLRAIVDSLYEQKLERIAVHNFHASLRDGSTGYQSGLIPAFSNYPGIRST